MSKMFRFDREARLALKSGVDQLAEAVRVTLGPRGRNVVIGKSVGSPVVTNDGITIVRDIELPDPYENLGAQLLREVANKTAELAGDGTTTATLLAQAIVSKGLLAVTAGENPMHLKRGIERAVGAVIDELKRQARPVQDRASMTAVATQSSHMDRAMGELVAEALEKVGPEGVVTIENSKSTTTRLKLVDGMRFDRGYLSPYFVNDPEKMEVVLEDARVLLVDQKVSAVADLFPILEQVAHAGCPLLLIAEEIEAEALTTLVMNHLRGVVHAVGVKAPGFGDRRRDLLLDLAVLTGATLISADTGVPLEKVKLAHLGKARRVVVSRDHTTLVGAAVRSTRLRGRCDELRHQIDASSSTYDRDQLKTRLAHLSGGVAEIQVGAQTEMELLERKSRLEDALAATRAAVEEGIVPGGGVAYLRALPVVLALKANSPGEQCGIEIVRAALECPLRTIVENAGYEPATVLAEVNRHSDGYGFDAETGQYCDLWLAGIVDPAKVSRLALLHAASIGSLILTTETIVADKPDESTPPEA